MGRYDSTRRRKMVNDRGSVRNNYKATKYQTTIYEAVPERDTDIYVTTQPGDRLDNLAFLFYGNASHWWFIATINNLTTMNVPTGTSLRIPASLEKAKGK